MPNEKAEDRHDFGQVPLLEKMATYWLVLDGHGGPNIAEYCYTHFYQVMVNQFENVKNETQIEQALKGIRREYR